MYTTGITISFLIFIVIILFTFFSKTHVNSNENSIFSFMLILNFFGLVIDIFSSLIASTNIVDINSYFSILLSKFMFIYYMMWTSQFLVYIYVVSKKRKQKKYLNFRYVVTFMAILFSIVSLYSPMKILENNGAFFPSGIALIPLYGFVLISIFVALILIFKNFKTIMSRKCLPILVFVIGLFAAVIYQYYNPTILLMTQLDSLVMILMYFTIENPDVKMLEEFKIAKDRAEKANKEKEIFLYNITQDIRMPLSNIKRASSWINDNLSDIDSKSIKDGMYYINDNASIVLDKVNNVLDITNMEITNIKVYNTKYNIRLVLDELYKVYSSKVNNNVKLNFNIDSNIPEYLNGDSLRLKQLLTIILDNSCKYTEKGYVELNLNTIVKKGICRLIITLDDTGIGIKASDIENIFNKNNQNYNSLDKIDDNKKNLAIAKSIATLLGGILLLESEIGKGTTITFVLDQKIYEEKSESLKRFENDITTYISKKKVMVIVEDDEYLEKVVKTLSKYDIDIIKMELAAKGLEYIRLNKECDLIIMDEELKYLSPLEVLNKFKDIDRFNIPVAILTNNSKYLEDGFNYILNRNLDNNELDNLINNE